ncbi:MAG TPA: FxLYD domain-containing protein [Bryobacteraceae bacterium]|nr:FxLYD domain-containing protein [Bryobacteraceae bacterium]
MKRRRLLVLLSAPFSFFGQQRRKPQPATQIEVRELKVARAERRITLDGVIRNSGTRSLTKLLLLFDLLDADGKTISRRRGTVEEAVLEAGNESRFQFYVADHARAVEVSVAAEQRGQEIDVAKPGPYLIE